MTMDEEGLRAWALETGFAQCALCDACDFDQERLRVAQQPPHTRRNRWGVPSPSAIFSST